MTIMASLTFQACLLEDLEPKELFETFCIAVPSQGSPPILNHSGQEAHSTILKIIQTNKYLSDRALEVHNKATNFVAALRGLASLINLSENKCEETDLHLENIERMVKIAENDSELGFRISRIRLLKFDTEQHLKAEADLAAAEIELQTVKEDLEEAVNRMNKFKSLRKAINECIDLGHSILAF